MKALIVRREKIEELKKLYIRFYCDLPIQKIAADFIGRNEDTIIRWKKEDKKFAEQVTRARSIWAFNNVQYVKSEWLLERVVPEYFGERKTKEDSVNAELEKELREAIDRANKIFPK